MSRNSIPINIEKIKVENSGRNSSNDESVNETVKFLVKVIESEKYWDKTYICDRLELIKLRDEINELLENTTTAEALKISYEKGKIVDGHYKTDELCKDCTFKLSYHCVNCLFVVQSPLERKLYLELSKTLSWTNFQIQYPLNWKGQYISIKEKAYGDSGNNFKDVLTIVDFYIDKRNTKLCIYTDGHTYHERTEEQAQRDRNIDRKLQELGFQVLRYTGKDVNENIEKIINEIKKWFEY